MNWFKKTSNNNKEVAVMESTIFESEVSVLERKAKNQKVVEEIHTQFNTASDKLLKEANELISSIHVDENLYNDLLTCGFTGSKKVSDARNILKEKKSKEQLSQTILAWKTRCPKYKFITHEEIIDICVKYDLAFGPISNYIGDVPRRCLEEIKTFKEELNKDYLRSWIDSVGVITGIDFFNRMFDESSSLNQQNLLKKLLRFAVTKDHRYLSTGSFIEFLTKKGISFGNHEKHCISNINTSSYSGLVICAPLHDMDLSNVKIGYDPVVLQPVKDGYLVITAWGIEASDPIILNEKNN